MNKRSITNVAILKERVISDLEDIGFLLYTSMGLPVDIYKDILQDETEGNINLLMKFVTSFRKTHPNIFLNKTWPEVKI